MFNKKKIEELKKTLSDTIEKNNKDISELKESLDKVLDTLESKNFSKDWEEYQKWKEMKDKLPDIEEMYQLKRLKELINKQDNLNMEIGKYRLLLLQAEMEGGNLRNRNAIGSYLEDTIYNYTRIVKETNATLEYIRSKSNNKDLIEVFKLYGISTEWLQP